MKESLNYIYKQQKELTTIGGISALLGWDQMTYMPKKGIAERSEQVAYLSKLSHEKIISDRFWKHIKKLSKEDNFNSLSEKDKNVVKRLKKDVEKSRKIPSDFVEKLSRATTLGYQTWEKARNKNDFKIFSPYLEKIVELEKEYTTYIDLPGLRYNSLLDDYEEGMTAGILKKEFSFLKNNLTKLLDKIKESEIYQKQNCFDKKIEPQKQKELCDIIIKKMNLPDDRSRLDESTHPFTTSINNDDVRITTNFQRKSALFSVFSTIHEAGHALYELGMPRGEYKDTVISDAPSLGLHESQSRFWENMIARSRSFWNYFFPIFKKKLSDEIKDISLDDWYRMLNIVKPSLIRVEADELTYCLHIILRFELEVDLIEEKIQVKDLPNIWNEKMDEMLGVRPDNDVDGVLQDMHWSSGNFGYFPTYAIGTIYASQISKKLSEEQNMSDEIEKGEFKNVISWLNKNIHEYGRLMTADEIIKKCCGEGLNPKVFVDYLKDKYCGIYLS